MSALINDITRTSNFNVTSNNGVTGNNNSENTASSNVRIDKQDTIKESAENFEAAFIVQMLKDAGFDKALVNGAGSAGETYSSFILEAYAERIVDAGGFGIASSIEAQLVKQQKSLES